VVLIQSIVIFKKREGGYILKIITKLYVSRNDDTTSFCYKSLITILVVMMMRRRRWTNLLSKLSIIFKEWRVIVLCTFKVPQFNTLYFRYYTQTFFVSRLIINQMNKVEININMNPK
jgi:hypothetical protein